MGTMYKKQIKTAIVNPVSNSGIIQAVSQNVVGVSKFAEDRANIIKKQRLKQAQLEYNSLLLDATSSLSNSMYNSYSNLSANPEKLGKDFMETKNKLSAGLPDEMKLDIEKQYLTLKNTYLIKANENYKNKLDSQNRDSILSFIDSKLGSAQVYYDNMFNGTLTPETTADYQINKQVMDKTLLQTGTKGQNLIKTSDVEKINKTFNQTKLSSAFNHFNGLFENDTDTFVSNYDKWIQQPQTIQEQYDLSQEDYNKITSYIGKLKKSIDEEEKDGVYSLRKTPQQKIMDAVVLTELDSRYKFFNIKNKDGKFKIRNSDLNNVESVIDFRNAVREARANNNITNSQYKNFLSNTTLALNQIMGNNKRLKDGDRWFITTAGEQINNRINDFFKNDSDSYIDDRVFFYENAFNVAKENKINLNASDQKTLDSVNNIMDAIKEQYVKDRFVSLKEKTNAVVFGNNVISYDRKSGAVGNKNLNNGGYVRMKDKNGNEAMVLKDSTGKIIDVKKI